jgi:hypothetical protein
MIKVMQRGFGGDIPENNLEAIIAGIKKFPNTKEIIMIADNFAAVRDMVMLEKIKTPVKVILCGVYDLRYNCDYLNIAKQIGKYVKIDFSTYYTLLDNALVRRDFTLNGASQIMYDGEVSQVQAIQNAAKANVYGIQAGVEVKMPSGFRFSTDLNFQKGEEELDNGDKSPSRHAAPFFGISR